MKNKRKNSNYKINFEAEKNAKKANGKKFLITFVCIFLSIVILTAIIVGVVGIVNDRNAVVKYDGVSLTEAELNYFVSYCKYDILKNNKNYSDTPEFWDSKTAYGTKYSEILAYSTEKYIRELVIMNYIFDKYSRLTSEDKRIIDEAVDEVYNFWMGSDKDKFNQQSELNGFTYSDYHGIVTKIYKYSKAYQAFSLANGERITNDETLCNEYYSQYSKVKLLFINTEKDYKYDENGKRVVENNKYVYVDVSPEEKAKREADIALIRDAIKLSGSGSEFAITEEMMSNYIEKYPSPYGAKDKNGFYLHKNASYTSWFASDSDSMIVNEARFMEVGSYREVETDNGVCFVYRMPIDVTDKAFLDTSSDSCFLDFYKGVIYNEFEKTVLELSDGVEIREAYSNIDLTKISKLNEIFLPRT